MHIVISLIYLFCNTYINQNLMFYIINVYTLGHKFKNNLTNKNFELVNNILIQAFCTHVFYIIQPNTLQ